MVWVLILYYTSFSFSTEGEPGLSTGLAQFSHCRLPVPLETKVYAFSFFG